MSETENIRKNLAIERMITEGCEILLDTSQTFVRQGMASAPGEPRRWGQVSPGASPLELAAAPTSVPPEYRGLLGTDVDGHVYRRRCSAPFPPLVDGVLPDVLGCLLYVPGNRDVSFVGEHGAERTCTGGLGNHKHFQRPRGSQRGSVPCPGSLCIAVGPSGGATTALLGGSFPLPSGSSH